MSVAAQPPKAWEHRRRPWRVEIETTERFEWEVYTAMREWLNTNVGLLNHSVHVLSRGMRSIKYVAFKQHGDAVLFYLRFA